MQNDLLFEHLLCNNLTPYYAHIGADMYRACVSETKTYNNGLAVGKIYALAHCALLSLKEKTTDITKRGNIENALDKLSSCNSYDELNSILTKLNEERVLF